MPEKQISGTIKQYTSWAKFLQVIFCHCSYISTTIRGGLHLDILCNTLSNCTDLDCFNVSQFRRPCTFSRCHKWLCLVLLYLYVTWTVDKPMLYEAIPSPQFPPLSNLPVISSSWRNANVTCFLLTAVPCLMILGSQEVTVIAWCAQ